MKTWVLMTQKKSKGYFNGWKTSDIRSLIRPISTQIAADEIENIKVVIDPTFTAQIALTNQFISKEKCDEGKQKYLDEINNSKKEYTDAVTQYITINANIHTFQDTDAKIKYLNSFNINHKLLPYVYYDVEGLLYYLQSITNTNAVSQDSAHISLKIFLEKEPNYFVIQLAVLKAYIKIIDARLEFLNKVSSVRRELTLKKLPSHNDTNKVSWRLRGSETSSGYCTCCGYAIPNVHELVLRGKYGSTRICLCCLNKLIPTIKKHVKNTSKDIIDAHSMEISLENL